MTLLMLGAAVRAAVLIALVWAALALGRADVRLRSATWRAVLVAVLCIPVVMPFAVMKVGEPGIEQVVVSAERSVRSVLPQVLVVPHHPEAAIVFYAIAAVALVFLLRIVAGLLLTLQVARHSPCITAGWTEGIDVRDCRRISVPVTLGHTVLLPSDYVRWPADRRAAVMAHERAHVENHDFYWQILAQVHRAIFWFNPLAWWLVAELSRLDELVSDEAAIAAVGDRPNYAEVLLTMSDTEDYLPSGIAMARTAGIKQRIEHVLSAVGSAKLSTAKRAAIAALAVPIALIAAIGVVPARAQENVRPVAIGVPHRCSQYYPREALRNHVEGRNTVLFDITPEGKIANIQISETSGSALLDAALVTCVANWQYSPPTLDGKPVTVPWRASVAWSTHGRPRND